MSLRQQFRAYRRAIFRDSPVGDFSLETSEVPARPFILVTAAYPRRRARAIARNEHVDPEIAEREDGDANGALASRIGEDGREAIGCMGVDPEGPHSEASFWVWDATVAQGLAWGRAFDQFAIIAGDGLRAGLLPCFPGEELEIAPDVVLLLHERGGSPDGAVALIERELRTRGWDHDTRYLRPAVDFSDLAAFRAWLVRERVSPMLAVGVHEGGLFAIETDAPTRIGVASPWAAIPPTDRARLAAWPGWMAVHGGRDRVAPAVSNLAALPPTAARLADPEAGHEIEPWAGRIADGIMRLWNAPERIGSATAAGWRMPGFQGATTSPARRSGAAAAMITAGIGVMVLGVVFALAIGVVWIGLAACAGSGNAKTSRVLFELIAAGLLTLVASLLFGGILFYSGIRTVNPGDVRPTPPYGRIGAALLGASMALGVIGEVVAAWISMSQNVQLGDGFHVALLGACFLVALCGAIPISLGIARAKR